MNDHQAKPNFISKTSLLINSLLETLILLDYDFGRTFHKIL